MGRVDHWLRRVLPRRRPRRTSDVAASSRPVSCSPDGTEAPHRGSTNPAPRRRSRLPRMGWLTLPPPVGNRVGRAGRTRRRTPVFGLPFRPVRAVSRLTGPPETDPRYWPTFACVDPTERSWLCLGGSLADSCRSSPSPRSSRSPPARLRAPVPAVPAGPARPPPFPPLPSPRTARRARSTTQDHPRLQGHVEGQTRRPEPSFFQESYAGSTTQAQNVVNGLPGRRRGALARARRATDRGRRPDHARLDRGARRGHGLDLGRRLRRPTRQPEGHQGLERPRAAGPRDPDARPGPERRRPVEHRVACGVPPCAATCPVSPKDDRPARRR